MSNHKSAAKRARQSIKRSARQKALRSASNTWDKKVRKSLKAKDPKAAAKNLLCFASQIDKAAKKGAVSAQRASRRISRLSKQCQQAAQAS